MSEFYWLVFLANFNLFKVNNRNTRKLKHYEICLKLMTEHISCIFHSTFFVDFAQVNVYCYGFHNFKLKFSSMKNMGSKQESQLTFTRSKYDRNTRKSCEVCLKLTIETPERRQWRGFGVFIINFGHIWHLFLVFLPLTLNK